MMKTIFLPCCQRGAMFGLDARIALAIFGGLAIITGAALFSVLSEIGVTRRTTEMNNIGKAVQAFALDTGTYPAAMEDLLHSSVVGWKGPYFQIEDADGTDNNILKSSTGDDMVLHYALDSNWTDVTSAPVCPANTGCGIYIQMVVDSQMGERIDLRVDGVASANTGGVRLNVVGASATMGYNIGYKR